MWNEKKSSPATPERGEPAEVEYKISEEISSISTSRLTSGLPYQRPVRPQEVSRMVREWDDHLMEPVVVSKRDGKCYLVDGQHRVSALRRMNRGNDVVVPCKICTGLTYEQEAELCYKLDKAKRHMNLSQSTNTLTESRTDPDILEIRHLVEKAGFHWALNQNYVQPKKGEIASTRTLIRSYHTLGTPDFFRMLNLLRSTWQGDPHSLTAAMLSGMTLFLKTYSRDLSDRTFVMRLARVDPMEIIRKGRADFSTNKVALRVARILLSKYNGQRWSRKLPYRLED